MSHDLSFYYADLLLKKHFLLLSMLKTVVLPNVFVELMISFLGFFDELKWQKNSIYLKYKYFAGIKINIFTATFDQPNGFLLKEKYNFFSKLF